MEPKKSPKFVETESKSLVARGRCREDNGTPLQKIPWTEEPGRLQSMGLL